MVTNARESGTKGRAELKWHIERGTGELARMKPERMKWGPRTDVRFKPDTLIQGNSNQSPAQQTAE